MTHAQGKIKNHAIWLQERTTGCIYGEGLRSVGEEGSRGWSFLLAKHWGWETEGIVDNVRDLCCASPEGDETLCLQCLMGWRGSASSGAAATGGRDVPPPDAVVHSVRQNAAGECVASVRAMPAAAASALCWFGCALTTAHLLLSDAKAALAKARCCQVG